MAAPTFVTEYRDASNIAIATSRTVSVTTQPGDVLVAWAVNSDAAHTINAPTGGTGLTWTLQTSNTGNSSYCEAWVWTAIATVSETFTFTITAGGTYRWIYGVQRWSGASGVGAASNTNVSSGAPSLGLTTTAANSGICLAIGDWNAGSITGRTWRTANVIATETFAQQVTSAPTLTAYAGYHSDAGTAGAKTVGLSAPSGQKYTIVAVEILAQTAISKSGSDTVTFGLTDNAAITERGVAGSDTVTFGLTDNAVAAIPVQKAGSDTITFGLTDTAAAPDKSTIKTGSDTVTFGLTDNAVRQAIGPLSGTWVSPPIPLPEEPIAGSILYWQANVPAGCTLRLKTSLDNAATWQEATNLGPVPNLAVGSDSAKSLLVQAIGVRPDANTASPELIRVELRVALDSHVDEWVQLGRFRLRDTEVVDSPAGIVLRISGQDMASVIARNTWDESLVIPEGTNGRDAVMEIISNRWSDATFNLPSTEFATTRIFYGPGVSSAGDPWQDARKVARDVCGWELFPDAYGVITGRPVPDPDTQPSVFTLTDKSFASGPKPTMVDLSRRMTDQDTYNQVIVIGQATSNAAPVWAMWQDTNPASHTRIDGDYGKVTKTIRSDKVASTEQAQQLADAEGRLVKGATEVVRITALPAAHLEPGDIVEVDREWSKTTGRFMLDGWHFEVGPNLMTLTTRRQRQ